MAVNAVTTDEVWARLEPLRLPGYPGRPLAYAKAERWVAIRAVASHPALARSIGHERVCRILGAHSGGSSDPGLSLFVKDEEILCLSVDDGSVGGRLGRKCHGKATAPRGGRFEALECDGTADEVVRQLEEGLVELSAPYRRASPAPLTEVHAAGAEAYPGVPVIRIAAFEGEHWLATATIARERLPGAVGETTEGEALRRVADALEWDGSRARRDATTVELPDAGTATATRVAGRIFKVVIRAPDSSPRDTIVAELRHDRATWETLHRELASDGAFV